MTISGKNFIASRREMLKLAAAGLGVTVAPVGFMGAGRAHAAEVGGDVYYIGWEGEDFKSILGPIYEARKINLKSQYITNNGDLAAKFSAGGGQEIDLIDFSSNSTARVLSAGVPLAPLDLTKLPNRKGLTPFFVDDPQQNMMNANGEVIGIPIAWGAVGLTYDKTKVSGLNSWSDVLDPKFEKRIAVVDDASNVFSIVSAILGFRPDKLDEAKFEQVKDYARKLVKQSKVVTPSFGDMANLLVSGEIDIGWGGYNVLNVIAAQAGNANVVTTSPSEVRCGFIEIWGLSSMSDNAESVYALLNDILDPATNAAAAESLALLPTVGEAFQHLKGERDTAVEPANQEAFFKTMVLTQDPPQFSDEGTVTFDMFMQAWAEIKADI
jgi:putative spermidine/putrescine transport system substrate-binding protein